jgi:hypothetical protein
MSDRSTPIARRHAPIFSRALSFALTVALVIALSSSFERTAYAYVDPGSGLFAFQSLSAMVAGALFYFRKGIKSLLQRPSDGSASSRKLL